MKIKDSNKYGILSADDVSSFERRIKAELPVDYREFLLNHNGGKPIPCNFDVGEEGADTLHHIYGLNANDYSDLYVIYKCFEGRIPRQLLAVADDPGGNQICIGVIGKYRGKVYFWDHEMDGVFPKFRATKLLANSFNEFLASLFEYIDPEETDIEAALRTDNLAYFTQLLDCGYELESVDRYDRTLIENAAIKANGELIKLLHSRGAKLRASLSIARSNARFFDRHKEIVLLIEELSGV